MRKTDLKDSDLITEFLRKFALEVQYTPERQKMISFYIERINDGKTTYPPFVKLFDTDEKTGETIYAVTSSYPVPKILEYLSPVARITVNAKPARLNKDSAESAAEYLNYPSRYFMQVSGSTQKIADYIRKHFPKEVSAIQNAAKNQMNR